MSKIEQEQELISQVFDNIKPSQQSIVIDKIKLENEPQQSMLATDFAKELSTQKGLQTQDIKQLMRRLIEEQTVKDRVVNLKEYSKVVENLEYRAQIHEFKSQFIDMTYWLRTILNLPSEQQTQQGQEENYEDIQSLLLAFQDNLQKIKHLVDKKQRKITRLINQSLAHFSASKQREEVIQNRHNNAIEELDRKLLLEREQTHQLRQQLEQSTLERQEQQSIIKLLQQDLNQCQQTSKQSGGKDYSKLVRFIRRILEASNQNCQDDPNQLLKMLQDFYEQQLQVQEALQKEVQKYRNRCQQRKMFNKKFKKFIKQKKFQDCIIQPISVPFNMVNDSIFKRMERIFGRHASFKFSLLDSDEIQFIDKVEFEIASANKMKVSRSRDWLEQEADGICQKTVKKVCFE